ncbi:MAG TPA: hypothetical protein VFF58_00630 [Candidatus Nitrosotalea sp.]|nr:hypothetical protein [Candidatus Nitrosotalea sp.]
MTTAATAAATVDSATTQTPATPAVTEYNGWDAEGTPIRVEPPKAQDSAPAKEKAAPDSAPDSKSGKTADNASDSATDKDPKPHLKTKEDTEKRFKEILDENKTLQRRIESLERGERKTSDTRETKQDSQPAAEVYKPLDEKEFFKGNPAAGQAGHKTYEDFVRASGRHEGEWAARQAIAAENQRRATEAAAKELNASIEEAKKRYPDYQARIEPAVKAITEDQQIPFPVKAVINDSPAFVDLMYVLAEPTALADLIATAKTNPAAAIRKIVLTEQLVIAELAKAKGADKSGKDGKGAGENDGKTRDASGKFVSPEEKDGAASEPKPRAPKPPSEVGGRGTASEDALVTAAKSNNFKDFETEQWRRKKAARA